MADLPSGAWNQGQQDQAAGLFRQSLMLRKELGDRRGISTSLTGLAAVAAAVGRAEPAAVLFGAAEALRETLKVPPPPFIRDDYDRRIAVLRRTLGDAAFAGAWGRGRAMNAEQAVAYGTDEPISAGAPGER